MQFRGFGWDQKQLTQGWSNNIYSEASTACCPMFRFFPWKEVQPNRRQTVCRKKWPSLQRNGTVTQNKLKSSQIGWCSIQKPLLVSHVWTYCSIACCCAKPHLSFGDWSPDEGHNICWSIHVWNCQFSLVYWVLFAYLAIAPGFSQLRDQCQSELVKTAEGCENCDVGYDRYFGVLWPMLDLLHLSENMGKEQR